MAEKNPVTPKVEAPVKATKPVDHTVVDGDNFASIAAAYLPAGMTKHAYAVHLSVLNYGATMEPGTKVAL